MRKPNQITVICLILLLELNLHGQTGIIINRFDSLYNRAMQVFPTDTAAALKALGALRGFREELSDIQRARLDYLQMRIINKRDGGGNSAGRENFSTIDSLGTADSMQYIARRYLERSMPDRAIPLLMRAMEIVSLSSDTADHLKIELCEAYRQKQEYEKGIRLIYGLLESPNHLSDRNQAYAYNRLAALYNESGKPSDSYRDSVIRYSRMCLELAGRTGDIPALATAQNELGFQYIHRKEYDKALDLFKKSESNFRSSGLPFQAMNTLINQSNAFMLLGDNRSALQSLREATLMAPLWANRNLYMRIYWQYANVYAKTGHYKEAWEFLGLVSHLQVEFFSDRINSQILEQSARFDLYVKEQQIREEQKKNEFTHRQIILLVVIIIAITLAFLSTIFYIRLKRKGAMKQKLIEAVVETENNERRRIARDLHDGLGPVLSAINHYFQAYLDSKPENREAIQARLQMVISEAIDEVSRISHNISPHVLEKYGLITALNNLFAPLIANGKYEIIFEPGPDLMLDQKISLTVYRCITELLNNTLKHAGAVKIILEIKRTGENLTIEYADNGKGFNPGMTKHEGMGLPNITSRVESSGGTISIESSPDAGVRVYIKIPV